MSRGERCRWAYGSSLPQLREDVVGNGDASGSDASSQTPLDLADRESLLYKVDLFSAPCH
jgi:hypothetical protein